MKPSFRAGTAISTERADIGAQSAPNAVAIEPEAVSVKEAGDIIGVGRSTTYKLIQDGRLPSFKIGKRHLVRVATARALVASLEQATT